MDYHNIKRGDRGMIKVVCVIYAERKFQFSELQGLQLVL